ncbi:uncharacterized protein PHACADRAFT_150999 [Phanerochaete carnosa HHB-10118-sp]|uniref:F-box domain-containing protein n=1 Tax=Phanerochaete carnosa (strain HHB-10118-sp) TaxID=650164 RepID=K5WP05_PHACS|nr:uncharacterized protein PHACADRAFT_150999 [Phanerochaete carnosa HHB-10118-sp]EKM52057.1 hypothetical protein PHACADRAFT_150999 [Phanerochaete carnosa HHB-10118-sp]
MANRHFPPELVNKVVGHVCDQADGATLKAASLVCLQWQAISRPYVFHRVVVTTQTGLESLEAFLQSNPDVTRHIRILVAHPKSAQVLDSAAWVTDVPSLLAPLLVNLQAIELIDLHEQDANLGVDFGPKLADFTTVHTLTLRACFMDPPLLYTVISALPALRSLVIAAVLTLHGGGGPNLQQLRGPRLESLDMYFTPAYLDGMESVLPWLATTETVQSIRSLRLIVRLHDSRAVGQFIEAVGGELEELDLELEAFLGLPLETASEFLPRLATKIYLTSFVAMKQNISIVKCSRLRSFALYDNDVLSVAALGFINELNSPHLETISLTVTSEADDPEQLPDLSMLAAPLAREALSALKAVRIGYQGPLAIHIVRERIQMALPEVHFRGHLIVFRA